MQMGEEQQKKERELQRKQYKKELLLDEYVEVQE
jgi:hypothetical protein